MPVKMINLYLFCFLFQLVTVTDSRIGAILIRSFSTGPVMVATVWTVKETGQDRIANDVETISTNHEMTLFASHAIVTKLVSVSTLNEECLCIIIIIIIRREEAHREPMVCLCPSLLTKKRPFTPHKVPPS